MSLKETYTKYGYNFKEFESKEDAANALLDELKDRNITFGGSVTARELDLYNLLSDNNKVAWHWKNDKLDSIDKDVFISSTNAMTEDGKLVNRDGTGNRVSSMLYGHKDVYIVVGQNKLVKDVAAGIDRIEQVAAPLNGKRLGLSTPCAVTGRCTDCNHPDRMCNMETVIHRNPAATQIHIYYIKEDLGY